jgi:hypothetical protein
MKRSISLVLSLLLLLGSVTFSPPASAAIIGAEKAAETLVTLKLLTGDENGDLLLGRSLTREQGVVLICRLLGLDDWDARTPPVPYTVPFSDVSEWAQGYISHAYYAGIVKGSGGGTMNAAAAMSRDEWATFLLRALGYSDPTDFTWTRAGEFAAKLGISAVSDAPDAPFNRADAIVMMYEALITRSKGGGNKLIEELVANGHISTERLALTPLAGYANFGRHEYSAAEIYERASAANFYVELFASEEDFDAGYIFARGSGFFITADGVALTAYHVIEMMPYARIYMTDGRVFSDIEVLWRDGMRDLAIIKVGKTDEDGKTVSAFPYLPLGNAGLISAGERVFAMGSPGGHDDSISEGVIGKTNRAVIDPEYPNIQFTAAISPGSSGGSLINRFGEVIGVVAAAYPDMNSLFLAVPVRFLPDDYLSRERIPLAQAAEEDIAANNAATIKGDMTELEIHVGEVATVIVSRDTPGLANLNCESSDEDICEANWGVFTSVHDIPLYIEGISKGKAVVTVVYLEGMGNPDAKLEIKVTVLP